MSIVHVEIRQNPYVQIDKRILSDIRLSWKAKGLLVYLLSKPTSWDVRVADLVKQSKDGRDAVYSALRELKDSGYVRVVRERNKDGTLRDAEYFVYELPLTGFPDLDNLNRENPYVNNNDLSNNDLSNNDSYEVEQKLEQEESAEDYFDRVHPPAKRLEVSPITKDNYKERIQSAIDESLARVNDKDLSVETYVGSYPEGQRPLVRAFMELWGCPPVTKSEDKFWRKEFSEYALYEIRPEFIAKAYAHLSRQGIPITSPKSVKMTALSMQKAEVRSEAMDEYEKLCQTYESTNLSKATGSDGRLMWARGYTKEQVQQYNLDHYGVASK